MLGVGNGGFSGSDGGCRLSGPEQLVRDYGVSLNCASSLLRSVGTVDGALAALHRAEEARPVLESAVSGTRLDWRVRAAIGIHETGFPAIDQTGAGLGREVSLIDLRQNSSINEDQANDPAWSAGFVARTLGGAMGLLSNRFNLGAGVLIVATAATHNAGWGRGFNTIASIAARDASVISHAIDRVTPSRGAVRDHGWTILRLMGCF